MKRATRQPQAVPVPRKMRMPLKDYQPSKAEMEEQIDMPEMTDEQLRDTFFRPFKFVRNEDK